MFTDPYTEGYIGITNDIERRNKEHLRAKTTTYFTNALNKYKDIEYKILHLTDVDTALALEYEYRSQTNIGWNTAIGGNDTLKLIQNTPIHMYHKDNYVQLRSFASIAEAANTLGIPEGRIRQAKHRGSTNYGKDGWAILHDPMFDRSISMTYTEAKSIVLTGIKRNKPSHFKGITNRWSNEDKQRISKQHKGKTISTEHRQKISEANRKNPNLCKAISLAHRDAPTTIYTFHSISEASRQLNLPISRLKSKAQRPINVYGKDGWKITSLGSE